LVFAADRRLTKLDGSYGDTRQKLFRIPHLNAGISYFGLAYVYPARRQQYMSEWLRAFITKSSAIRSLRDFAFELRNELERVIPSEVLGKHASGFHVCGYDNQGFPEFWYLSNIGGMSDFQYTNIKRRYADPTEDFLNRDAKNLGWNGKDPESVENKGWVYRNGDIRAHAVAFELLDQVLLGMLSFSDFRKLEKPEDLARWVRFKLKFVAQFYKEYGKKQIIGTPIDAFSLTNKMSRIAAGSN
ncbi:MAG: hypothetical protein WBE56_10620, partial [Terracidiphilus sp.]